MTLACRLCGAPLASAPSLVVDPAPSGAQHFGATADAARTSAIALRIVECPSCALVQSASAPPDGHRRAITAAGLSAPMRAHRLAQARALRDVAAAGASRIVLVGCGSGYELEILAAAGWSPEGVEAGGVTGPGVAFRVHDAYPEAGRPLPGAPYDAFATFNFLEHAPAPLDFLRAIAASLTPDGVGVVEVPNFARQRALGRAADYVADHLAYFTADTLRRTLELAGFEVLGAREVREGENLEAVVRRRTPQGFAADAAALDAARRAVREFFEARARSGAPAIAWGASHQALTLLAAVPAGAAPRVIVDSAPFKQGRFAPPTGVPVVAPSPDVVRGVGAVLVIAAGYEDEIVRALRGTLGFAGEVWAPRGDALVRLD